MRNSISFPAVIEQFSEANSEDDAGTLLKRIRDLYGLKHVAYFASRLPKQKKNEPQIAVTYNDAWIQHYKERNFVTIDPVVSAGLRNILPTDWSTLDRSHSAVSQFFGEASEFDVGRQGLTLPVRGTDGETAMLSITSDEPDKEWAALRKFYIREFQVMAMAAHDMILRVEGLTIDIPHLSRREIECLKWASEGKTYADTATILNISTGTVKSYMEMSRKKLNALNTTHTVTRAIKLNII